MEINGYKIRRKETAEFIAKDGVIYRLYVARMSMPDGGLDRDFPSIEHAVAWVEDREPNSAKVAEEIRNTRR